MPYIAYYCVKQCFVIKLLLRGFMVRPFCPQLGDWRVGVHYIHNNKLKELGCRQQQVLTGIARYRFQFFVKIGLLGTGVYFLYIGVAYKSRTMPVSYHKGVPLFRIRMAAWLSQHYSIHMSNTKGTVICLM